MIWPPRPAYVWMRGNVQGRSQRRTRAARPDRNAEPSADSVGKLLSNLSGSALSNDSMDFLISTELVRKEKSTSWRLTDVE